MDTNRELYNGLLQRYREIGVAGGVGDEQCARWSIRRRRPTGLRIPRLIFNMLLSLFIGVGVGVGLAFLRETIDDSVNDPSEVESRLGLPLLGVMPKSGGEPLEEIRDPKSSILRGHHLDPDESCLLDRPRHAAFAGGHQRDPRGRQVDHGSVDRLCDRSRQGLRTVLVDARHALTVASPQSAGSRTRKALATTWPAAWTSRSSCKSLTELPFHAIAAGQQPPNAAELLRGDGLQRLIAELLRSYDHVIIDSPPVMGLADAPLIASATEGAVFVVEAHGKKARLVRQAIGRLRKGRARLLGTILCKFDARQGSYGYGHEYGYGYGHTYGAEAAKPAT